MIGPMRGVKVASVFGIDIRLDRSWFLISVLIAWSFSTVFAQEPHLENLSGSAHFLLGTMGAVLFFMSVLAHEVAHALMAKRKGISVEAITLFIFGGVAQIKSEPKTAGDEFKIAVVGPLMSIFLGLVFYGMGVAADRNQIFTAAVMFGGLGIVNVYLAVFNMLPGLPLDGGRILRAALWRIKKDFYAATKIAAVAGRVVAALLIAGGIYRAVFANDIGGGAWWIIIGMFMNQSAIMSHRHAMLRHSVEGVAAANLMTASPVSIPGNMRLDQAVADHFVIYRQSAFPVTGYGGELEGLLTLEAVQAIPQAHWPSVTVRQVMVPLQPSIVADPAEPVTALLERIDDNPAGSFLIVQGRNLIGILTTADIAKALNMTKPAGVKV